MRIISVAEARENGIDISILAKYFINNDCEEFAAILSIDFENDDKAIDLYNQLIENDIIINISTFLSYSTADFEKMKNQKVKFDFFESVKENDFIENLIGEIINAKNLHKTVDVCLLNKMKEIINTLMTSLNEDLKFTKEICKH